MPKVAAENHAIKERIQVRLDFRKINETNSKSWKGVFPSDLINRCVEKWFAEQEKFDEDGQEYYKHRGNNYTQMMWKASKKCEFKNFQVIYGHFHKNVEIFVWPYEKDPLSLIVNDPLIPQQRKGRFRTLFRKSVSYFSSKITCTSVTWPVYLPHPCQNLRAHSTEWNFLFLTRLGQS